MWPYMDLDVMSVVFGPNENNVPGSFTILAGGMADSDDHKGGLVGIITLDQGKRSLREQTLAGLILILTNPVSSDVVR